MGFRLVMLMAMGLGAMYMMHLLAQDYNKIRQPVARAIGALSLASNQLQWGAFGGRAKRQLNCNYLPSSQKDQVKSHAIDWNRILSRDPFGCLQSLICQMLSGMEFHDGDDVISGEAIQLIEFIECNLAMAPAQISRAYLRGLAYRGRQQSCFEEYPLCWYSARTMLRMLSWFGTINNNTIEENETYYDKHVVP